MDKTKSQELLTNEVTQHYMEIINAGIAKFIRKTGNNNLYGEFNDWFQDCFMELIEFINREERLPSDAELWTIIRYKLIDKVRYGARRNHADYDELEHDHGNWSIDPASLLDQIEDDPNEIADRLLSKFPEDSKERIFLEFFLESAGIRDFGYNPPKYTASGRRAKKNGYNDDYLATEILGLPGQSASSFKTLKWNMIKFLEDELELSNYLEKK